MDLMCVSKFAKGMTVASIQFKMVAFLDQPSPSLAEISSKFTLHDKDFQIYLLSEN